MMPTHGLGIFRTMLLGSVTSKILHDANCPVWTATHAEEQMSLHMPEKILCAVDDAPSTTGLMQWAAEFSGTLGATLQLIHVVPRVSDWLALPTAPELQEQVHRQARDKIESVKKDAGILAPLRVAVGNVADCVTAEATVEKVGLIIVGRGSLQSALGRLRTHAYGIIQKSPCPVISV
jgi:nucleotide-binding universal stress UspA family protein